MKFSFPSIQQIGRAILDIVLRFPSTGIVAVVGSLFAIYLVEHSSETHVNIVLTCLLGLPFTLAVTLLSERYLSSNGVNTPVNFALKIAFQIVGLILLTLYYLSLPYDIDNAPHYVGYRLALFVLAAHFAVAIAPFVYTGSLRGFWRYNEILFVRFLTAVLYSVTLFAGLSIAILAVENLFEFKFHYQIYSKLFIAIAGIFNTFFFLYGIPRNLELFEQDAPYPWELKLFTQYVLLPLVTIYLLILYAYTAKIIGQWHLPEGWVSYLVLCFSVAGILSLLLVWPLRDNKDYDWVRWYSRGYFIALVPLIVLLFVAATRRISDYGITVNRYLLLILSLWLAGVTLYFIFSRVKNIKILPLSLCIVAFLSAFGPWGAFYIAQKSQTAQLKKQLAAHNMIDDAGKINKASRPIPAADVDRIRSIAQYLCYTHGTQTLNDLSASSNLTQISDTIPQYMWPDTFLQACGIVPAEGALPTEIINYYAERDGNYFATDRPFNVWMNNFSAYLPTDGSTIPQTREFVYQNRPPYTLNYDSKSSVLSLSQNKNLLWSVAIDTVARRLEKKYAHKTPSGQVPAQEMTLNVDGTDNYCAIYLNNIEILEHKTHSFDSNIALFIK